MAWLFLECTGIWFSHLESTFSNQIVMEREEAKFLYSSCCTKSWEFCSLSRYSVSTSYICNGSIPRPADSQQIQPSLIFIGVAFTLSSGCGLKIIKNAVLELNMDGFLFLSLFFEQYKLTTIQFVWCEWPRDDIKCVAGGAQVVCQVTSCYVRMLTVWECWDVGHWRTNGTWDDWADLQDAEMLSSFCLFSLTLILMSSCVNLRPL